MGNWLNTYQKVTSQTGTPVTLFTDHAPWRDNPWVEIRGAGRRYRNNGKGGWEIQQASQSSGTWDPINVVDEEYWTNYVNDIDKKRKETPAQNIFQKLFGIEGKTPEKACGGKVQKGEDGMKSDHYVYDKPQRKYEYNEPDYMNHYTPKTDIDRTGTRPRYDAVTGRIHRTTLFKVPEVKPNFAGLMAPEEVRQYIDPKTYRIQTITGPTDPHYRSAVYEYGDEHDESIRDRMKNNNGIFYLGNDDWGEAGYDVITWPDGSRRVVQTSAPKIYIPKGDYQIPSNPNDNTQTSGSIEKGNIKGGSYPGIQEPIQAPEGYNPADEWEEIHDQVNGKVIVTWRNKKTGRITRIKPFKTGGKISDLLNNQEFLVNLEKCGGKMKKKACGGKMKKKK